MKRFLFALLLAASAHAACQEDRSVNKYVGCLTWVNAQNEVRLRPYPWLTYADDNPDQTNPAPERPQFYCSNTSCAVPPGLSVYGVLYAVISWVVTTNTVDFTPAAHWSLTSSHAWAYPDFECQGSNNYLAVVHLTSDSTPAAAQTAWLQGGSAPIHYFGKINVGAFSELNETCALDFDDHDCYNILMNYAVDPPGDGYVGFTHENWPQYFSSGPPACKCQIEAPSKPSITWGAVKKLYLR